MPAFKDQAATADREMLPGICPMAVFHVAPLNAPCHLASGRKLRITSERLPIPALSIMDNDSYTHRFAEMCIRLSRSPLCSRVDFGLGAPGGAIEDLRGGRSYEFSSLTPYRDDYFVICVETEQGCKTRGEVCNAACLGVWSPIGGTSARNFSRANTLDRSKRVSEK